MTRKRGFLGTVLLTLLFAALAVQAGENDTDKKKVLTLEDYPQWKRISSTTISEDGVWVTFAYEPNEGDGTLYIKNLTRDTIYEIAIGSDPEISSDSLWVAYVVSVPEKEAETLRRERKPVTRKVEVMNLDTGEKYTVENASTFKFSADSQYVAIKKDRAGPAGASAGAGRGGRGRGTGADNEDAEEGSVGTDLILRNLKSGLSQNIGNVARFDFNKAGNRFAYTVSATDKTGNGIYLLDLKTHALTALDTSDSLYEQLTWDEEGTALAVVRGKQDRKLTQRENSLLAFTGVGSVQSKRFEYIPGSDASFPEKMVLSEKGELTWSEDNGKIFFGIKEQRDVPKKSDEPRPDVEVGHWKDERVQSVQMRQANRDRDATYQSVLHLANMKFVQLADSDMPTVTLGKQGTRAVGRYEKPYRAEITWGGSRADYYRLDTATGERTLIVQGIGRPVGLSPDSQWYLYMKDKLLYLYNLDTGETRNLSENISVSFVDEEDDHPYEKPIYGLVGWSKDGKSVILNHRFDLWSLALDGSGATNLTAGVGDKEKIQFRYVDLDPAAPPVGRGGFGRGGARRTEPIDTSKPMLLSAYGEWTKKSGYFTLAQGGQPKPLLYEDRSIGRLTKAKNADRVIYTMQTFVDFPDYYVSGLDFAGPTKFTDANPQQKDYAWGRRILIDFVNSKGVQLQATLALPAGYEEGKRYPMLVYHYEKMSQQHHQYSMPRYDDRPHFSTYASDGYLVLQPDIVYETGRPGDSAMDCVGSAVRKVIELGYADKDHIGLQGHSWGGYQSSFMVTQTDLFAAVVTGAPVTNLVSFYNELYKSSGNVQHGIMEYGQVRMGTIPWENMELYHSQSPVHQAQKITTPFLILHGTEDGAVDWHQGLEYYNTARRLGKNVILLSYPGEGHHLARKENQKDFLTRMKQFFDHYLKEAPAPDWMINGVDFLDKEYASPLNNP